MTTAPLCACCGKKRTRRSDNRGWNGYHGYCPACAERWREAGKPAEGPPPAPSGSERAARISAALRAHHAACGQSGAALRALAARRDALARAKADRLTDYAWLISFGEDREAAAARAGISAHWARYGYEPMLAAAEAAKEEAA